uniref:Stargazin-like protein n=1 Tax=Drosophila melanogaster TaxID=7227 RepID=Q2MGK8_DROME|nr:stargazin-like protein [Drosophila melanogaster]AAZ52506.2 stargazin-like protein [Drosophila melanogaster]
MRDYPSVPNVFRVASTHSINSENPYNNIRPANVICNTTERPPIAIHQLTTSASIEHSHPSQQAQHQQQQLLHHQQQHHHQQHSPYATLPRGQRLAPQQHQQAGVINTISGSIPATGFSSLAGSFSDLQLNNIGNHSSNSRSNHNSISNNRRQQQQQQQQQQQRLVPHLSRHQPAIEVQQTQQHQQTQQQHVQRQQQQERLASGGAGATDPQGGISNMTTVNGGYLWLITPVAASISVAIVIAALAGPQWLFTEEKLPNANYNGTANFKALDDGAYITKYTKSSLWILCTTLPGLDADSYNCVKIDYFSNEGYQPDPHDSTAAIPYTVTKSCPIFLAAGVFLVISFIVFLIPTCSHQNNLYYFSAGILFIVSGLVMLIGLIAYISILKAEIGSKLRPRSTLQPALIKVSYGQSFFLFVFGFIVTEFVGVLNIFLFINLQEVSYYSRLPCFSVANIHAKLKEGQHPLSDSYKRYKQPGITTASQEGLSSAGQGQQGHQSHHPTHQPHPTAQPPHGILRSGNSRLHQVYDAGRGHPGMTGQIGHSGQTQTLPGACRKHPNAGSNLNLYLHNDLERRFYFEKPAVSKCNLHSRSFAKSLNELCTDTSVSSTHVPAPLLPSAADPLPAPALFADLPQEFPLTRSVSTATEIYPASSSAPAPPSAQMKRKQQRNMATNTNTKISNNPPSSNSQMADQSRLCGLKRGLRKTKDELFQEFCRRAGMRSKPKNIYYISGGDEAEEEEQEDQAKREEVPDDPHRDDDDDADGDDHGFRQFNRMEEEHLYVVGDHAQLVVPRRTSMCVDSMGQPLRRLNSNLSLHTDLSFPGTGGYPGMRMSLPQPADLGQSRTLPRCFLRQSSDSLASQGYPLGSSQQRFSQLMLNQQQNRFVSSTLTLPQVVAPKSQVQWPTAIPSSPSNYSNGYQQHPQPIYPAPTSGSGAPGTTASVSGPPKFQRGYAFDDQQRRSSFVSDAFDLDEIERERRRSHASLFGMGQVRDPYDLINGTAV